MNQKIKSDNKLSEEQDRDRASLQNSTARRKTRGIQYKPTEKTGEISLIRIIREEAAVTLSIQTEGCREMEEDTKRAVEYIEKRNFPPKS